MEIKVFLFAKNTHIPMNTNDTIKAGINQASMSKEKKEINIVNKDIEHPQKVICLPTYILISVSVPVVSFIY